MRPRPRAGVVWEQGEPVRLSRAHAIYWYRRPKLCSDTLIDLIADMEPQKQAEQGSDGAAKLHKHVDNNAGRWTRRTKATRGSRKRYNMKVPTCARRGVVWMEGEPVRLSRAHAHASSSCPDDLDLIASTGEAPFPILQPAGPQGTSPDDLAASMEPQVLHQGQAKQGSDGAAKHAAHADNGAASEVRVVVRGSCPFVQVAGSGQLLREDSGSSASSWAGPFEPLCFNSDVHGAKAGVQAALPVDGGPEARVQAGDRKREDERLLDELKALRLQVLGLGAQEAASN